MIDLKKIQLKRPELTTTKIGELLFPGYDWPELAVKRLLSGKSELTESQIRILSTFLAISPCELFNDDGQSNWLNKSNGNAFILQKGTYVSVYDPNKGIATILHEGKEIDKLVVTGGCQLNEYIGLLDSVILKNEGDDLV